MTSTTHSLAHSPNRILGSVFGVVYVLVGAVGFAITTGLGFAEPTGHLIAVALLALAGLAVVASLAFRPPRSVPAATWRLIIALTAMFVLAPATRFGYMVYPVGLLAWLEVSRMGAEPALEELPGLRDPGGVARSANSARQDAYQ